VKLTSVWGYPRLLGVTLNSHLVLASTSSMAGIRRCQLHVYPQVLTVNKIDETIRNHKRRWHRRQPCTKRPAFFAFIFLQVTRSFHTFIYQLVCHFLLRCVNNYVGDQQRQLARHSFAGQFALCECQCLTATVDANCNYFCSM